MSAVVIGSTSSIEAETTNDVDPLREVDVQGLKVALSQQRSRLEELERQLATVPAVRQPSSPTRTHSSPTVYTRSNKLSPSLNVIPPPSVGISPTQIDHQDTAVLNDPYSSMWSNAKNQGNPMEIFIFDRDLLESIYHKPYTEIRPRATILGSGVAGLLAMPFGPIGMVAGGMFGAMCGTCLGFVVDTRRRKRKVAESAWEKKRLKSLVRWAAERFNEDDKEQALRLIEMVVLEFKPMADIASGSKGARSLLLLLEAWVSRKTVTHQLWVYLDELLRSWQDLTLGDFVRRMFVLQTLTAMYHHSARVLVDQENLFLQRMEHLLEHSSVQSVMQHARMFPRQNERRAMECIVFADQRKLAQRRTAPGSKSPSSKSEDGAPRGDSDSDIEAGNFSAEVSVLSVGEAEQPVRALKKPFFNDWNDFMDFDLTFKYKMPVTLSELTLLLEKEKEGMVGWDLCVDRPEIRVAKVQTGIGCITLRAWAVVPGIHIYTAFYLFHNVTQRVKWDKVLQDCRIVEPNMSGSEIIFCLMKIPGITTRDFLQYRRAFVLEDGSIAIVLRSAEHASMPEGKGESKGNIRVESYISGYVLRQGQDAQGKLVLNVFLLSCSDVKGLIPKFFINYVAPRKPAEWVDTLSSACHGYQSAHPNYETDLKEYAMRFKSENPFDYDADAPAEPEEPAQGTAAAVDEPGSLPAQAEPSTKMLQL